MHQRSVNRRVGWLACFLCGMITISSAQWQNHTLLSGGNNRMYRLYVPADYSPSDPATLVLTLHGLGDNAANFSQIGMNLIADTANIIVAVPQAWNDIIASTAWNSGAGLFGYYPNAGIDDVAFISALIDTLSIQYAIAPGRVFCCGFSMGGFMTQRLACELNDKINAFASVAGTFGAALPPCTPGRAVSVAHFHGTADQTVPYDGPQPGIAAPSLITYWVENNQCNHIADEMPLPNLTADGITIDHLVFTGGDDDTRVELFRANGADHVWLSAANDIAYTAEIWHFFNRISLATSLSAPLSAPEFSCYPNPVSGVLTIEFGSKAAQLGGHITLMDALGRKIGERKTDTPAMQWDLSAYHLPTGQYFLTWSSAKAASTQLLLYIHP